MIILEKYIALFIKFQRSINQNISTSIEEISKILFCTPRNSKSVLKKLVNLEWINWTSGIGRGNKSKLVFLKQPHNLIIEKCMELVKHGDIKSAWNIINSYNGMYPNLTAEFNSWIDNLFGYNVETNGSKKLDILRLKIDVNPIVIQLDPIEATFRSDRHVLRQISDTLIHYNSTSKQFEPRIAFFWEYNKAKQSWYIYLNKGIKFHNGKSLTSKDVLYTFSRFKTSSNNAYKWMLKDLENITIIDDYTLEFNLKNINHLFIYFLSDEHLSILPCPNNKNAERKIDKFLIGTGPFKITRNDADILVLEANDNYFMGRAFLDRVELWGIKDSNAASLQHDITHTDKIKYGLYPKQMTNNSVSDDFKHMDYLDKSTQYLTINLNKEGPFKNSYFRKAFRNILNTNNMIEELGGERYASAEGFIFSNIINEPYLDYNCRRQLLAKSNYNGESLNLYTYDHGLDHIEDTKWIQKECGKFGIIINIKLLSSEELMITKIIDEADIIHDSCTINESIEISYLDILLSDISFIKHHLDPDLKHELDTKITELYKNGQEAARIELLKNIEMTLIQHNNVIPLYRSQLNLQSHNVIQNVFINTLGWVDFYHIWFKKN